MFFKIVATISDWLWGPPLIILFTFCGLFLTIRLGFFQFKYAGHIVRQAWANIFRKQDGEGTISPFQSLSSALACAVGAGNIVGVPAAIMLGGPGAVFWMWIVAILGMASMFAESVLAVRYRERNEEGEYVGGPMYYMTKGLGMRWLGIWFAIGLMFEVIPSTMIQSNSVASTVLEAFDVTPWVTGIVLMLAIGSVIIGGIRRIGKVTERLVPLMALFYVGGALIIVIMNIARIPEVFQLIFTYAFKPMAPVGGFAGATIAAAMRWGFARGVYSNEAGLGTAPIAHAAAITDHPVRQGLWAVWGVIIDTLVVCSATAFVVLSTGVWTAADAVTNASALPARAFALSFGPLGSTLVAVSLLLFVTSTIIVLTYYGEKQAEFLFGLRGAKVMKYVYVACIFLGSVGGAKQLWQLLDISLASIAIPNIIAILLLSGQVNQLKNEFFGSKGYYLQGTGKAESLS